MHSVADLTTFSRPTTGDVPPKLVGASTTVVGDKMYIFGGRLVAERRMVSDMYAFDMETYNWEKIIPTSAERDTPRPRYFHSCDTWNNHLVVFGGMGTASSNTINTGVPSPITTSPTTLSPQAQSQLQFSPSLQNSQLPTQQQQQQQGGAEGGSSENLCVLSDVRFFDLEKRRWLMEDENPALRSGIASRTSSPNPALSTTPSTAQSLNQAFTPRGRYAHLSSITYHSIPSSSLTPTSPASTTSTSPTEQQAYLYIIGGQDLHNLWLDDICIFSLHTCKWVARKDYPRHSGTYRSIAVTSPLRVRYPLYENLERQQQQSQLLQQQVKPAQRETQSVGWRFGGSKIGNGAAQGINGEYTHPDSFNHLSYSAVPSEEYPCDIFLYSNYNFTDVKRELEVFTPLPPSPTPTSASPHPPAQATQIDFQMSDQSSQMTGQTLPPGLRFPTGAICGSHLIFAGTYLANSYQSFSIWALDLQKMTWTRIEPGTALSKGSWFKGCLWTPTKDPGQSRFVIFGNKMGNLVEDYNRRLLSWEDVVFLDLTSFGIYQPPTLRIGLREQELGLAALEEGVGADFEVVCDDGRKIACSRRVLEGRWEWFKAQRELLMEKTKKALETIPTSPLDVPLPPPPPGSTISSQPYPDPRLTPRTLLLSEPYPVTLALLQYFYSLSLITPLQHAPAVLSQLLLLASNYDIRHLKELVQHAMHGVLSSSSSVGVYEVATLCGCQSLQIRALKAVMASSKKSSAQRLNTSGGAPSDGHDGGSGSGPGNNGGPSGGQGHHAARPRGMSDLRVHPGPGANGGGAGALGGIAEGSQTNGYQHQANDKFLPGHLNNSSFSLSSSAIYNRRHQHHMSTISVDTLYRAIETVSNQMINDSDDGGNSDVMTDGEQLYYGQDDSDGRDDVLEFVPYRNYSRPTSRMHERSSMQNLRNKVNGKTNTGVVLPSIQEQYNSYPSVSRVNNQYSGEWQASAYQSQQPWSRVQYSDSDRAATPSLKSSTSIGSLNSVYRSHHRSGHSPNSPDSPALETPMDAYFPNVGIAPSLSSIKERSSFESMTPRGEISTQKKRPAPLWISSNNSPRTSISSHQDSLSSPPPSAFRTGTAASIATNSSSGPQTPVSATSTASPMSKQNGAWPPSPLSSSSITTTKRSSFQTIASQMTIKAEREMLRVRMKADKLEEKAWRKAEEDRAKQQASLLSPQERKALKAEEKRRKKEEEKLRIEQLALELKARAKIQKEVTPSIRSGTSTERKATEWVENSGGMYGGMIGWGSL